jgi:hypothetical protein
VENMQGVKYMAPSNAQPTYILVGLQVLTVNVASSRGQELLKQYVWLVVYFTAMGVPAATSAV